MNQPPSKLFSALSDYKSTKQTNPDAALQLLDEPLIKFTAEDKKQEDKRPEPSEKPIPSQRKSVLSTFEFYPLKQQIPWLSDRSLSRYYATYIDFLDEQIYQFINFIQPTAQEMLRFTSAFENIRKAIIKLWPEAQVHIFGSFKAGLALFNSDIDVIVICRNERDQRSLLHQLKRHFLKIGACSKIEARPHAKVPILVLTESEYGVELDIQFNRESGAKAALMQLGLMKQHPDLKPMVLFLKAFLKTRSLNQPYNGGVGSYCLFLMVTYYLQYEHKRYTELKKPRRLSIFVLLRQFFKFYGSVFKWQKFGISVTEDGYLYDRKQECEGCAKHASSAYSTLCIESPEDANNDAGRSSFRFSQITQAFRGVLNLLGVMAWEKKGTSFLYELFSNDKEIKARCI